MAKNTAATKNCPGVPNVTTAHTAPLADFNVKLANPDGHSRRCRACQAADRKARATRKLAAAATEARRTAKATSISPVTDSLLAQPAAPAKRGTGAKRAAKAPAPVAAARKRNRAAAKVVPAVTAA